MSLRNNSVLPLEYFANRSHEILALIYQKPNGTRKDIAAYLGLGVNQVTHPVLSLIRNGFVVETGQTNEIWPSATLEVTAAGIQELKELNLLKPKTQSASTAPAITQTVLAHRAADVTPTPVTSKKSLLGFIAPKYSQLASDKKADDSPLIQASSSEPTTEFDKREAVLPTTQKANQQATVITIGNTKITIEQIG